MFPESGKIAESIDQRAALDSIGGLGHEVLAGLALMQGKPAATAI